jgi:predicted phage terminase large subunit-like protein
VNVNWTKAHLAQVKALLALMEREARPFADTSAAAVAARKSLPFDAWIHTYFPHYASCESSPSHLAADEMIEEKGIPIAEFWFRGAGKTTRALLRRVRRILERRSHFLIVGGQTEENAAEKLDLIKLELVNNARLKQDYESSDDAPHSALCTPHSIAPRSGDNTDTDWIAVETRVLARGTGQSCRGLLHGPHRPDDFLGDDLEDDVLARNPQREKHLWEWLFGNVFPALAIETPSSTRRHGEHGENREHGERQSEISNQKSEIANHSSSGSWCEILLNNYGTRHGLKARFQEAAGRQDSTGRPLCRYIEYLAEDERGESAWPERFPTAALRRMSAIMGRSLYGREMLGKAYSDDEVFRPEWIRDFHAAEFDRSAAEVRVAVDPSATAKETSDYKALVVLARPLPQFTAEARSFFTAETQSTQRTNPSLAKNSVLGDLCPFVLRTQGPKGASAVQNPRHYYVLHAWLRRASPNELIAEILRVHDEFSPGRIGCEANGFQAFLWPLLEANEEIRGRVDRVGLFPITNAASKEDRILSLQPDFERGLVHFDESEGDQRLLLDQFLDFGKPGVHDDGPDAFEMARRLFPSSDRAGRPREPLMRFQRRENFTGVFAGAGAAESDEEDENWNRR